MIEIMRFRLLPSASEAEFLAADKRLQTAYAYQQPGLERRTTARGHDGDWIVIDLWRSATDSCASNERWDSDEHVAAFMALVDRATVTTARYETLG